jgi:DNA-binding XRE family transcriptional regulator
LKKVAWIRHAYKLSSRYDRLRRRGMLTTREVAAKFGVARTTIHEWGRQGLITKHYADSLNRGLWSIPSGIMITKGHGGRDAKHAAIVPSPQ